MAFKTKTTLDALRTFMAASGYFKGGVEIGEPKSPPQGTGLTASIIMAAVNVSPFTLGFAAEIHTVTVRVYQNAFKETTQNRETEMSDAVFQFIDDLLADWQLGGNIHHIDTSGEFTSGVVTTFGYLDVGGTMFRIADIVLPLVATMDATMTA